MPDGQFYGMCVPGFSHMPSPVWWCVLSGRWTGWMLRWIRRCSYSQPWLNVNQSST